MHPSKIIFLLLIATLTSQIVSAQSCSPNYNCGEWGPCEDGLQSRVCQDQTCGKRDITERSLCGEPTECIPDVTCFPWSECIYTEKATDLIGGEIGFGGYKTRICSDNNNCVADYSEEEFCSETSKIELKKITQCDQEFIVAIDPLSQREIIKINLDSWRSKRLDIVFSITKDIYCPSCYDGIKNNDEESVDCGPSCKACKPKARFNILTLFVLSLWFFFAIFTVLSGMEFIPWWKSKRALKLFNRIRGRY